MGVPIRLAGFAAALLAVFGLAFGVGRVTGDGGPDSPDVAPEEAPGHVHTGPGGGGMGQGD